MLSASVVILQPDARLAQVLSSVLAPHFNSIHVARDLKEFRASVKQARPRAVVVDLESSPTEEVRGLHREFPAISIVCTHRLPDDAMWMQVLEAGATDVCPTYDPASVVRSVLHTAEDTSGAAA